MKLKKKESNSTKT